MTTAMLLAAMLAAQVTPPQIAVMPDGSVLDWASLPTLPYRVAPQVTPPMNAYVRAQARVNHCRVQRRVADRNPALRIEVAVLLHPEDGIRTTVPRAAGCPAVEQYAAGLVTSFARNNLSARANAAEQWYRATVTFVWTR